MCDGKLVLDLPDWIGSFLEKAPSVFDNIEAKMRFAIALSEMNVKNETGGPFGAGVFEQDSGKLIAAGVNVVIETNCSLAHAEMVCIGLAQQKLKTFDLGAVGMPSCELVTSTEPCAMCLGAIPWSGIRRVIFGARGRDACEIGFDEGDKVPDWADTFESRGITILRDVLRNEAREVLIKYKESDGLIYNGRQATFPKKDSNQS
jgi:tRNA(Arg) A34 adenosine deaminase TadA